MHSFGISPGMMSCEIARRGFRVVDVQKLSELDLHVSAPSTFEVALRDEGTKQLRVENLRPVASVSVGMLLHIAIDLQKTDRESWVRSTR